VGYLRDDWQAGKLQHELITQRVMAIALGYEDANDAARLACDPIHKLLVGRDPIAGEDLASAYACLASKFARCFHFAGRRSLTKLSRRAIGAISGRRVEESVCKPAALSFT
jgi:hypothetical protein